MRFKILVFGIIFFACAILLMEVDKSIRAKILNISDHIKVFFITLDEDNTLSLKSPAKKGRAIVEVDSDGCYVLSNNTIETSPKLKYFSHFIEDLKAIIKKRENT